MAELVEQTKPIAATGVDVIFSKLFQSNLSHSNKAPLATLFTLGQLIQRMPNLLHDAKCHKFQLI